MKDRAASSQSECLAEPKTWISEGIGAAPHPVRGALEARSVVEPLVFVVGVCSEHSSLPINLGEPSVRTKHWVFISEEFLRIRLEVLPRRVSEDRVESRPYGAEHVGELQLPVEEAHLGGNPGRH